MDPQDDYIDIVPDEDFSAPDFQKKYRTLKDTLTQCELEKREYLDGWQRAKADFINYKNEEGHRLEDLGKFITAGLIHDILPVLDSFDLAFQYTMPPEMERGVLLIRAQFEDVLKKRGLEEVPVAKGEQFNPEKHESIGEVDSDAPAGAIAEVVQKGYSLRGRIIRPARVRLSKG